jgi:hypothetical protein
MQSKMASEVHISNTSLYNQDFTGKPYHTKDYSNANPSFNKDAYLYGSIATPQ